MPKVRCTSRKMKGCIERSDVCQWDGEKCKFKENVNIKEDDTVEHQIRCSTRKEKGCKSVPEFCSWDEINKKCIYIDNHKQQNYIKFKERNEKQPKMRLKSKVVLAASAKVNKSTKTAKPSVKAEPTKPLSASVKSEPVTVSVKSEPVKSSSASVKSEPATASSEPASASTKSASTKSLSASVKSASTKSSAKSASTKSLSASVKSEPASASAKSASTKSLSASAKSASTKSLSASAKSASTKSLSASVKSASKNKPRIVLSNSSSNSSVKSASKTKPRIVLSNSNASTSTASTNANKELFENIKNRHCNFYSSGKDIEFSDKLTTTCSSHYDSKFKSPTNVHIGQRKLMLSEMQLLIEYYKLYPNVHPTILYVGSAPGSHLNLLSKLFPQVKFVLYDGGQPFNKFLSKNKNIEIHDEMMTIEKCKTLKDKYKNLVFISDIRLDNDDFEHGVSQDMVLQDAWIKILKPKLSLLKFRMAYSMKHGETISYLKGNILFGVWPKPTSGEARLLVYQKDIDTSQIYDFKDYEESMFFHNKYARQFCYKTGWEKFKDFIQTDNNPYCPCYDCIAELSILDSYATLMKRNLDKFIPFFATNMNWNRQLTFQRNKNDNKDPLEMQMIDDDIKALCKE